MTPAARRKVILLLSAVALGALVAADRLGAFRSRSGDGQAPGADASGARESYVQQAALYERADRLAAREDDLRTIAAQAREQWRLARSQMISAPTPEVASARLLESVRTIMSDQALTLSVWNPLPVTTPVPGEALRIIGLSLDFEAPNPDSVFRLIDRVENMPEVLTNIDRLSLIGPGRNSYKGVKISLELRALAWVGSELPGAGPGAEAPAAESPSAESRPAKAAAGPEGGRR